MNTKALLSLAGALMLAAGASSVRAATTNVVSLTTFDPAAAAPWSYGYFYNNNGLGSYAVNHSYYLPDDTDMTNGLFQLTFDITDLNGMANWGLGAGAPLFRADTDPALFVSGDRANYLFNFDTRAEGLLPGQTASGEMQVQFYRKDDANQDVLMLQVNLPFQATANWQTLTFNLGDGVLGAGTADADFEQFHAATSDLRFNVNFNEPFQTFGYDGDNAVYVDNVRLQAIDTGGNSGPQPERTEAIVDWNMDDKGVWYEYNYDWSQNDNHLIRTGGNNANNANPNTLGVGGGSGWFLNIDTTSFADNTPQFAGAGTGGGGPADYTRFNTNDLASYRVSFDARAEGIAAINTAASLQIFLDAPDDTVQPADADADDDRILQLNFNVAHLTGEFQHYTFSLGKGALGGGSKENFQAYFDKINNLRTQWQIENAASAADWGFDADNMLVIDNIKVERVYQGLQPLTFSVEGNELVLTWTDATTGTTKLQSADTVDGSYTDVNDATGGTYRAPMNGSQKYFRLIWTAPANP